MITKTDYTIEKCGNNIMVWNKSKLVAHGFNNEESALQGVWVLENSVPNHFYAVNDGKVVCIDRNAL